MNYVKENLVKNVMFLQCSDACVGFPGPLWELQWLVLGRSREVVDRCCGFNLKQVGLKLEDASSPIQENTSVQN